MTRKALADSVLISVAITTVYKINGVCGINATTLYTLSFFSLSRPGGGGGEIIKQTYVKYERVMKYEPVRVWGTGVHYLENRDAEVHVREPYIR